MPSKRVIVIGSGLSGLASAALLSKKGFSVTVIEQNYQPGGSSGAFKKNGNIFDVGSAMMFGFGETGFNPHTFLFNEIQEDIDVVKHDAMYRLHFGGKVITFYNEFESFFDELGKLFPKDEINKIKRFYNYLDNLYSKVVMKDPTLIAPSEIPQKELAQKLRRDPINQLKILFLLSKNATSILKKFTKSKDVIQFFNKITSTYSYTTMDETPAIMAVTMFIENHKSGSYYIHGSTQVYVGKLEKAIEKYGGNLIYGRKVVSLKTMRDGVKEAILDNDEKVSGDYFIYSGTVYNLYSKLLADENVPEKVKHNFESFVRSPSSIVMYAIVDEKSLPKDVMPIEMITQNKETIDETEITLYITTVDDPFLNISGMHNVLAIGPSFRKWPSPADDIYKNPKLRSAYEKMKEEEANRIINYIESHFPGFKSGIQYYEIGTPTTIERYTLKNFGSVAGPKQMMGQELLKRPHASTYLTNLFMCGESTVMGTGTPAVVISGISAADVILRKEGMDEYRYAVDKGFVHTIEKPEVPYPKSEIQKLADMCEWCEMDTCKSACPYSVDIRGIMRRLYVENINGSKKLLKYENDTLSCFKCDAQCEKSCRRKSIFKEPVPIRQILTKLNDM
jgi:prolycopene isomerase